MKNLILFFTTTLFTLNGLAQYQGIEIEQVDNGGLVPGRTYRIFVVLTNDSDRVDVIFGDAQHPLNIESTEPFYQDSLGGALTTEINYKLVTMNKTAKYDSWVTIGLENNASNAINNFTMDFTEFEKGGKLHTKDGAWFCTPDHSQVYAVNDPKKKKRVLIAQLTSKGKITGTISMQGKTADGTLWQKFSETFTCGK